MLLLKIYVYFLWIIFRQKLSFLFFEFSFLLCFAFHVKYGSSVHFPFFFVCLLYIFFLFLFSRISTTIFLVFLSIFFHLFCNLTIDIFHFCSICPYYFKERLPVFSLNFKILFTLLFWRSISTLKKWDSVIYP
jgi:hypothetical protein